MSTSESSSYDNKIKGRKRGVPNYNVDILLNVVESILPATSANWNTVAERYMMASGETQLRDGLDVRRFFSKCYNSGRKPGQSSSIPSDVVQRTQSIASKMTLPIQAYNYYNQASFPGGEQFPGLSPQSNMETIFPPADTEIDNESTFDIEDNIVLEQKRARLYFDQMRMPAVEDPWMRARVENSFAVKGPPPQFPFVPPNFNLMAHQQAQVAAAMQAAASTNQSPMSMMPAIPHPWPMPLHRREVMMLPQSIDSLHWLRCQRALVLSQLEQTTTQLEIAKSYQERMLAILDSAEELQNGGAMDDHGAANASSAGVFRTHGKAESERASLAATTTAASSSNIQSSVVSETHVRVGVGCFVRKLGNDRLFLMGKRKGSHGAGKWALPGGHLELGESWEQCAAREVLEETNLTVDDIGFSGVANTPNMDGNPMKHYVTIFMNGYVSTESAQLVNMEPHKCESWVWMAWEELLAIHATSPRLLFEPLQKLIDWNPQRPF